jgi:hypothetical protein
MATSVDDRKAWIKAIQQARKDILLRGKEVNDESFAVVAVESVKPPNEVLAATVCATYLMGEYGGDALPIPTSKRGELIREATAVVQHHLADAEVFPVVQFMANTFNGVLQAVLKNQAESEALLENQSVEAFPYHRALNALFSGQYALVDANARKERLSRAASLFESLGMTQYQATASWLLSSLDQSQGESPAFIMAGVLSKKGGFSWQDRFFTLTAKELCWYRNQGDPEKAGSLLVSDMFAVGLATSSHGILPEKVPCSITIMTSEKEYLLLARSQPIQQQWVKALGQVRHSS